MSSKIITEHLKSLIDEVMKTQNVDKYEMEILGNGMKGDGYMGKLTYITIKSRTNGSKKEYQFFIKSAQTSDQLRRALPIRDNYLREIFMYNSIFPAFEQFQLENSIQDPFKKYSKCHKVCTESKRETVILENIKSEGFEMHNRTTAMNFDHIKSVFTHYARFHAVSMAMKKIKPELFRKLTNNMDDLFARFFIQGDIVNSAFELFGETLKLLNATDARKFEGYEPECEELLTKSNFDIEDPCTVIVHGDCWNNNFMFKYEQTDKSKPIDVRFLDFQFARIAHPIYDLSYFLYACCDKEILKNFDKLLHIYHSTLSDSLSQYGIDINTFFPLTKLKEDWKKIGKFGLYEMVIVLQFVTSDTTQTIDFESVAVNNLELGNEILSMKKDDKLYNKRVKAVLEHFVTTFF